MYTTWTRLPTYSYLLTHIRGKYRHSVSTSTISMIKCLYKIVFYIVTINIFIVATLAVLKRKPPWSYHSSWQSIIKGKWNDLLSRGQQRNWRVFMNNIMANYSVINSTFNQHADAESTETALWVAGCLCATTLPTAKPLTMLFAFYEVTQLKGG